MKHTEHYTEFMLEWGKIDRSFGKYGFRGLPMTKASSEAIAATREIIYQTMSPTPTHRYPLLDARTGAEVFVKHENHTPVGAFKVRGGLKFMAGYVADGESRGVITATRENHGQSIAFAAGKVGISATVVVPEGNSVEKNSAMQALGGKLVVRGQDFQAAAEHAAVLAETEDLYRLPSFHERLVVASPPMPWRCSRPLLIWMRFVRPLALAQVYAGSSPPGMRLGSKPKSSASLRTRRLATPYPLKPASLSRRIQRTPWPTAWPAGLLFLQLPLQSTPSPCV
jgi:hypothetical protein